MNARSEHLFLYSLPLTIFLSQEPGGLGGLLGLIAWLEECLQNILSSSIQSPLNLTSKLLKGCGVLCRGTLIHQG